MEDSVYRDMLIDLAECIDDRALERMKFKCGNEVKKRESEEITTPLQLFTALEQRERLGPQNTEFLKQLLKTCMRGKVDSLRLLENYESTHRLQNYSNVGNLDYIPHVIYVERGPDLQQRLFPQPQLQKIGKFNVV